MAITPVYLTSFEHGSISANGGGIFDAFLGTPGTEIQVNASAARTGSYGLRCAPTATTAGRARKTITGTATIVRRDYVRINTAPSASAFILELNQTSATRPRIYINPTGAVFQLRVGTANLATLDSYVVGQWHRVDWKVDMSANPWTLTAQIDGGTSGSGTSAQASDSVTGIFWGNGLTTGPAFECDYDDTIVSATLADYPIGAGAVLGSSPTSDGTHNAGTNTVEDNTGADIGVTTAWDKINNIPMSGCSTYITQVTASATAYAEVNYANDASSGSAIQGVIGLLSYFASGTPANNGGAIVIRDDATQIGIYGTPSSPSDMSESSIFYKSAIITAPGGGWTASEFNALKSRVGYSTDTSPSPRWTSLLLEYAVTAAGSAAAASPNLNAFLRPWGIYGG